MALASSCSGLKLRAFYGTVALASYLFGGAKAPLPNTEPYSDTDYKEIFIPNQESVLLKRDMEHYNLTVMITIPEMAKMI